MNYLYRFYGKKTSIEERNFWVEIFDQKNTLRQKIKLEVSI